MIQAFQAYVTAALFDRSGAAIFALGDGSVRFAGGERVEAHQGAILCACAHPSGEGVVTGGDDGRLVWSRASGAHLLAQVPGRWIDAAASSQVTGLIAFAAGREVHVRDVADAGFAAVFAHERSVADLAFDPKGRRIAAASYGGAALWYARIVEQKPQWLKWAGSHIGAIWSADGRFLVSAMQENQLHCWRVADAKDMRMGGYPAKIRSMAFLARGMLLVTSGAAGAVVWPFGGANGPMGKEASEIGFQEASLVTRVAGSATDPIIAAGLDDGRVWAADLRGGGVNFVKGEKGPPITALAMSPDAAQVAWGDEEGGAGVGPAGVDATARLA
jgi:WD40 repeat protein